MSKLVELTDASFDQEVLKSEQPVLVDYWAPWCGPCKMLMPVIEQVASERSEPIKFGKVNVDENEAIMARYGIRSVPTLMLFKNGEVVAARSGAMPKAQLEAFIDQNL
jgi:thioredoxin 1